MKTTIDIADALLAEAKVVAALEGATLRNLVEEGLRLAIARRQEGESFKLRAASFRGDGARSDVSLDRWDGIRAFTDGGH